MKTRLLFWLLLMGGVGAMTLHSARNTSATGTKQFSKCEKWNCENPPVPYAFYNGYTYDEFGDQVPLDGCDISKSSAKSFKVCAEPSPNTRCESDNSQDSCFGEAAFVPNTLCWVDFDTCLRTSALPAVP